jgi:hypothetical protein
MAEASASEEVARPSLRLKDTEVAVEADELLRDYKAVLLKSPTFQQASAMYVLGPGMPTDNEPGKVVACILDRDGRGLTVKHDPNKTLEVDFRGDDNTTKVLIEKGMAGPKIQWSYIHDDQRRKPRVYENTREAIGNSRISLGQLKTHLQPSV